MADRIRLELFRVDVPMVEQPTDSAERTAQTFIRMANEGMLHNVHPQAQTSLRLARMKFQTRDYIDAANLALESLRLSQGPTAQLYQHALALYTHFEKANP